MFSLIDINIISQCRLRVQNVNFFNILDFFFLVMQTLEKQEKFNFIIFQMECYFWKFY